MADDLLVIHHQQQYKSFPFISYCYVTFGLWVGRTGLGTTFIAKECFGVLFTSRSLYISLWMGKIDTAAHLLGKIDTAAHLLLKSIKIPCQVKRSDM